MFLQFTSLSSIPIQVDQNISLGVGLLRFARIFAMDRTDIVTLPIFDLRQCYLSLFTFRDQVPEITFCALVAESTFHALVVESN